jgi:hypothetical protein
VMLKREENFTKLVYGKVVIELLEFRFQLTERTKVQIKFEFSDVDMVDVNRKARRRRRMTSRETQSLLALV